MSLSSPSSDAGLTQGGWVRLTGQLDRMQSRVEDLTTLTEANVDQVAALLRHLTDPSRFQAMDERLADLLAAGEAEQDRLQTLVNGLNELGQTVAKLNRIQFKSNTLAELKDQQVSSALGALQDVVDARAHMQEARAAIAPERTEMLRAEARGEFAADLLPVLDGLEMALESGRALVERRRHEAAARREHASAGPDTAALSVWRRLAWALWGHALPPESFTPASPAASGPAAPDEMADALGAWLQGLEMVRTRFLALLAAVDIQPIEAEGQPFDPHFHLAMATESRHDAPDGSVSAVLRKGYRQRARVLRYAEVTVNHKDATMENVG